jgi:hypothetical protein
LEAKNWWSEDMQKEWTAETRKMVCYNSITIAHCIILYKLFSVFFFLLKQVLSALNSAEKQTKPDWQELFTDVYNDIPPHLK